jgi:hypothetical protein
MGNQRISLQYNDEDPTGPLVMQPVFVFNSFHGTDNEPSEVESRQPRHVDGISSVSQIFGSMHDQTNTMTATADAYDRIRRGLMLRQMLLQQVQSQQDSVQGDHTSMFHFFH